ncbi:hypothetical protein Syun_015595 [Stephania yunnanensis]|uniref:Uncharacterized protein n=1 Tax=Stephania yunnanensis TaxID=152371 RepID=A0AAP0JMB5_9MAGN
MDAKTLTRTSIISNPNSCHRNHLFNRTVHSKSSPSPISLSSPTPNRHLRRHCISPLEQNLGPKPNWISNDGGSEEEDGMVSTLASSVDLVANANQSAANESIWKQIREIALFAGPAAGLWICGPLMRPATVVCDYGSFVFMFLSIATSNMVATSLTSEAGRDLKFLSISMTACFSLGGLLVMVAGGPSQDFNGYDLF